MYFLNLTGTSHKHLTTCSLPRLTMIYNVSGTSQTRLLARVFERQHRMFTLAQRRHIDTLVDRAMQEDGISLNHAAENLQVSGRWHAALQDLQDITNPQGRDI